MIRWGIGLLLLGMVLAVVWPQSERERFAGEVAHSYCQQRPQPEACGPNGHPYDALKPWMGLSTPPPGAPDPWGTGR